MLDDKAWPAIPDGMNGIQIVAIARMVERVCGTAAAASYLAEAIAAFDKKARNVHANYIAKYSDAPHPSYRAQVQPHRMSRAVRQRTAVD